MKASRFGKARWFGTKAKRFGTETR